MFETISPLNRTFHNELVSSFLQKITETPHLDQAFEDYHNATFFIGKENVHSFCGGALLLKKKLLPFQRSVGFQKTILPFQKGEVWVCTLKLHIKDVNLDFESFSKAFYDNLYEKLVGFGNEVGTDFLYMVLEPGEYLCTEAIGFWPYVVEIRPQESMDGLFHGVLSLSKTLPHVTTRSSDVFSPRARRLAA
ncbi:MAG: hypothetical protein JSR85_07945 [Proteobacteria bacterium]|nr:hypothetical protein [Pseudomonadota bacterium]